MYSLKDKIQSKSTHKWNKPVAQSVHWLCYPGTVSGFKKLNPIPLQTKIQVPNLGNTLAIVWKKLRKISANIAGSEAVI